MLVTNRGLGPISFQQLEQHQSMFFIENELVHIMYRWCSFLENITEEMEIPHATNNGVPPSKQVYDEFVFVTKSQLEEIGAAELIGTNLVKDYMHGYFINSSTYSKLKSVSTEFDYEEYKRQKIQEKIEAKRQMRIPIRKKLVKVNEELAERLQITASTADDKGLSKKQREQAMRAKAALSDERFAKIFNDENFAIDQVDAQAIESTRKRN